MNELIRFEHPKFGIWDVWDGFDWVWFPLESCVTLLGYTDPIKAVSSYCKGSGKVIMRSADGLNVNVIHHCDVMRLAAHSDLPIAVEFGDWVIDVVYPSMPSRHRRTNGDRFRAMTDEELAVVLMCPNEMGYAEIDCAQTDDCDCYVCLLHWLKQNENGG